MVNKPLIRPYFLRGVALGGVARIPMILFHLTSLIRMLWNSYIVPTRHHWTTPWRHALPILDLTPGESWLVSPGHLDSSISKGPCFNGLFWSWYISGIYCQLGDCILPTTFYKNLNDLLISKGHCSPVFTILKRQLIRSQVGKTLDEFIACVFLKKRFRAMTPTIWLNLMCSM